MVHVELVNDDAKIVQYSLVQFAKFVDAWFCVGWDKGGFHSISFNSSYARVVITKSGLGMHHFLPTIGSRNGILKLKKTRSVRNCTVTDAAAASLLPSSLEMISVPRDGHCMFHALAMSMPSAALTHVEVCGRIVAHVIQN